MINTDDTGDLIEGGGSTQLQRTPQQQPPAAQTGSSTSSIGSLAAVELIFHEQVKRPAPTAPQQWLGPRLFASSEEAHPGCLAAHRLVGEIPSIGGGSSTSSGCVEDSGPISFGRVSHSALVAGGVGSVGSSSPAQLDRQLRWTLTRWRGTRSDAQRLGRQRLDKQHRQNLTQ